MLITYAYALNKNKKILEIIAPKYPKKFSITLSSVNLPKPGSFKSWLKRLIVINIPDNMKVMGYPAKNIREFLRDNK